MDSLFEMSARSCWLSGFKEEQQDYYKEYRLSEKGKYLWKQISRLNYFAKNLCSTYDESYCFNESLCCRRHKHLPFQCDYNDNEILAAYAKGNYDFGNLEQTEEFLVFKGAYEIAGYIHDDDSPYKSENFAILGYCLKYYNDNPYITKFLEKTYSPEKLATFQEPVEEETAEPESPLDEKEEESDEQKEEEWISYPCLPSNESNSLSLTLFDCPPSLSKEDECYVPMDSLAIVPMSKTCENNYATAIYDNPCYFDDSYDNPLFVSNFEMHGTKEFCLENVYDKALDDGPMLLDNINHATNESGIGEFLTLSMSPILFGNDQSSCYKMVKSGVESFNSTICELDKNYVLVDHEKHALCDGYIVDFIHDATENYYERGKYGCRIFHGTKTPLYMLQVTTFNMHGEISIYCDSFLYKMPMHRKRVRLKS